MNHHSLCTLQSLIQVQENVMSSQNGTH